MISLSIGLFGLGFACSKLLVVVILSAASGATLAACLVTECLMLLFVRVALGNWRVWVPVGDNTSLSILFHITEYALMLVAPIPVLRHPHVLTPSVYAGFLAWTLVGANPLVLALAYAFDDKPTLEWQTAVMALGTTTVMSVIGAVGVFFSMEERFRSSFYEHCTMAKHVRTYVWDERTAHRVQGKIDTDCDRELVRAAAAMMYARCYWPMDLVEPFVRENWCVIVSHASRVAPKKLDERAFSPQVALGAREAVVVHDEVEKADPE